MLLPCCHQTHPYHAIKKRNRSLYLRRDKHFFYKLCSPLSLDEQEKRSRIKLQTAKILNQQHIHPTLTDTLLIYCFLECHSQKRTLSGAQSHAPERCCLLAALVNQPREQRRQQRLQESYPQHRPSQSSHQSRRTADPTAYIFLFEFSWEPEHAVWLRRQGNWDGLWEMLGVFQC